LYPFRVQVLGAVLNWIKEKNFMLSIVQNVMVVVEKEWRMSSPSL
jgi:hypothetical protein